MAQPNLDPLARNAKAIVAATAGQLTWSWDGGMNAALATFPSAGAPAVLAALESALPARFDVITASTAPAGVAGIIGALGGLRPGQLVLCSAAEAPAFLFGAWWPWGNGQTVSLRIGIAAPGLDGIEQPDLDATLRGWMGL